MSIKSLPALVLAGGLMAGCISDEPLNAECDVEQVALHLDNPTGVFYHDYDTLVSVPSNVNQLEFTIRSYATVGLTPVSFKVTPGAVVHHQYAQGKDSVFVNGSLLDLSNEQIHHFLVVSQDKAWSRPYTLQVLHEQPSEGNMLFTFEDYALDPSGKYYVWQTGDENAASVFTDGEWKNGNPGFKLSKSSAKPLEYPSAPVAGGGPDGSDCLKLETRDTGPFGNMVNMRIASGSMFNGVFDVGNALKDALAATRFGSPFRHKPVMLRAWVKFERGETFKNRAGEVVEGVLDEPDFYVVMYRNQDAEGNRVQLDGSDVLSSPYIVGMGRLPHHYNADGTDQLSGDPIHGVTSEWQLVELPVTYTRELDPDVLANNGYSLIIDFASSWQGAYFQGAVGSKLYVDNVSLICE